MGPRRHAPLVLALLLLPLAPIPLATAQEETTWDFETGSLAGWTATGTAFEGQPTLGDNVAARIEGTSSFLQGDWWIATFENRYSPNQDPGGVRGDVPTGQMVSAPFTIEHDRISFLVGGTDDETTFIGLRVDGILVERAHGDNTHSMLRYAWDVSDWVGESAQIVIVDSAETGFVSADDFRFYDVGGPGDDAAPIAENDLAAPVDDGKDDGSAASDDTTTDDGAADDGAAEDGADDGSTSEGAATDTGATDDGKDSTDDASGGSTDGDSAIIAPSDGRDEIRPGGDESASGGSGSSDGGKGGTKGSAATGGEASTDAAYVTTVGCAGAGCAREESMPTPPGDAAFAPSAVAPPPQDAPTVDVRPGFFQRVFGAIGNFFGNVWSFLSSPFAGSRVAAPDPFAPRALTVGTTTSVDVAALGDSVHVAYVETAPGEAPLVRVATSRDRGATFADDVAVSTPGRTPTSVVAGASAAGLVVAWHERAADGSTYVASAVSRDGGRTFSAPSTVSGANAFGPQLAMTETTAHLVWREGTAARGPLHHVVASDPSKSAQRIATDTSGAFSVGARGARVDVAYSILFSSTDPDIFHAESTDGGRTWRWPSNNIISNYGPQYNPSVAVLPGRTLVAYEAGYPIAPNPTLNHHRQVNLLSYTGWGRVDPENDRYVRVVNTCACGDSYRAWTNPDFRPMVVARESGNGAHLVWTNATSASGRDLLLTSVDDGGGVGIVGEVVGRIRLGVVDLADAGGRAVVAWEDQGTGEVMVKLGGGGTLNASGSTGPSRAPSVAGVAGRAYVAWIDGTDGVDHLRFRAIDTPRLA